MGLFLGIFQQENGCDYTIRCGERVEKVTAANMAEAVAKLSHGDEASHPCLGYFGRSEDGGRFRVDSLVVYEVTGEHRVDVKAIFENLAGRVVAEKKAQEEVRERAELDRLRKKYG
jgi:hypothetical protein